MASAKFNIAIISPLLTDAIANIHMHIAKARREEKENRSVLLWFALGGPPLKNPSKDYIAIYNELESMLNRSYFALFILSRSS